MNWKATIGAVTTALMICPITGADGTIQTLELEEDNATLTFTTQANMQYTIQCTTNLADNSWINVGDAIIASNLVTVTTFTSPSESCYFRIIEEDPKDSSGPTEPTDPPPPPPDSTEPTDPGEPPSTPF